MSYKPGTVIGDYVVVATVGTGGMGTVYKVQHVITQRIEAMKLLAAGHTEPAQEQRFLREMQVQARLHHPNIAAVYNAFRYYDEFFLVMEFIDGESLESILNTGRLPLGAGLDYARQALFALGYAHAHGVVHRDIAPSNMIVTPDGTVKLTDFGLAKTATDIRLTHSGTPMGSPWYMSPEQVRGDAAMDARSDIYSLGVVLYEIATGSKPFDLASTFDVMRAHVELMPLAPSERTADVPPALDEIILTALAKDPNARFQSAEQFYAALEALQMEASRTAGQAAVPPPGPAAVPAMPSRGSWPPATVRRKPRFAPVRVAQTAAGTAACGLVLFGGYATSAYLRSARTQLPVLAPAKANIPLAQDFLLPSKPEAASVSPIEPNSVQTPPAPPQTHRIAARRLAAPAFRPAPAAELPPPPPHLSAPGPDSQSAALPVLAPPPALPGAALAARRTADPSVNLVELQPQPAAEPAPPEKKHGNRFLRALHKVVPFHREESSGGGAIVTGPEAESH